ncbi:MAG TPA: type II toxin-antitoxin system VapC family toxin [Chloroflexota bacterium]|nr:type II toxin-antitoxin system VapC family toxin [Chloroflexota bacterium]
MTYLLDTNVISEVIKPRPTAAVVAWFASQPNTSTYLSVLTLGEIEQGIVRSPNPQPAQELRRWLEEELPSQFHGRVLSVDATIMKTWGRITGHALQRGLPTSYVDSLLAATAITHDLIPVTRNIKDVEAFPVQALNPWTILPIPPNRPP